MAEQTIASVNRSEAAYARQVELERHLIGWMLKGQFDATAHAQGAREIAPSFHQPHDRIMAAIFAADDDGEPATPASIALRLADDRTLSEMGGFEYLREWTLASPALVSVEDARQQIERAVAEYSALAGKIVLEERTEDALTALRAGSPDALERISELSRSAEILASARSIVAAPFQYRAAEEIPTRKRRVCRRGIRAQSREIRGGGQQRPPSQR